MYSVQLANLRHYVEDGEGTHERAALRERLDHAYDKMKFKRGEERALQQDLEQHEVRPRGATEDVQG